MQTINLTELEGARQGFIAEVNGASGTDVNSCYQCGRCSAGCPVAYAMDLQPRQVMRLIQLGLKDLVLEADTIWLCASCLTCSTRCPRGVDIAGAMDALRMVAVKERRPARIKDVPVFHDLFLGMVRATGRSYEVGLIAGLKLATGNLRRDLDLGLRMFRKGKLKLLPQISGAGAVRRVFANVARMEGGEG